MSTTEPGSFPGGPFLLKRPEIIREKLARFLRVLGIQRKMVQLNRTEKTRKPTMTKPDEKLGLDPDFYASRLEKMFEAKETCSFCCRPSPQTKRMIKSLNGGAICDDCLDALLAALPDFYAPNPEDDPSEKCLFCERLSPEVRRMIELGGTFICQDCVIDADVNLQRYNNKLLETGQDDRWDGGSIDE